VHVSLLVMAAGAVALLFTRGRASRRVPAADD
jgi:hypothetical protein